MKRMREYAVVRGNSTTGDYIMEKSSESIRRSSIAHIAYVCNSKKTAQRVAEHLNRDECPFCGEKIHEGWNEDESTCLGAGGEKR